MTQEVRRSFVEFLLTLPADKAARDQRIDYLDYWNNEPEKSIRTGHNIFSVWFHVTDPTQMALIHAGVLVVITLFTLGLFTRVTSVIVWIAVVGYIHRTQQVLFGMDTMMNILLFYLMIGNSGAALSLDRLIARYRAVRASLRRTGAIDTPTRAFLATPPPSKSAGFAIRLIQIHFCIIYAAAGLSKLKGGAWWNGQACWDVMVNPEFTLMQYEWYEKMLRKFVEIKPLYYLMIVFGVWSTLFVEIAGPFLMWTRLRWLIIFLASAMHAAIGVLMGLNLFELLMMVMLVAFLPDGVIRDRFRGGADLAKLAFAFNSDFGSVGPCCGARGRRRHRRQVTRCSANRGWRAHRDRPGRQETDRHRGRDRAVQVGAFPVGTRVRVVGAGGEGPVGEAPVPVPVSRSPPPTPPKPPAPAAGELD